MWPHVAEQNKMTDHTDDAPLSAFNNGRYAQPPLGYAPRYKRCPIIKVDVTAMPSPPPPDPGVEGFDAIQFPNHIHTATGGCPVWLEVTVDDAGVRTETYYYRDKATGLSVPTTSAELSIPVDVPLIQFVGTFHRDYYAAGADLTVTAAQIIADAIAAGTMVHDGLGNIRPLAATDFISRIDVDLKYIGGHGNIAGAQVTSVTGDADYVDANGVTDIDPGGSRDSGDARASDFYIPTNFVEVVIKAGSIVAIGVNFATTPA